MLIGTMKITQYPRLRLVTFFAFSLANPAWVKATYAEISSLRCVS